MPILTCQISGEPFEVTAIEAQYLSRRGFPLPRLSIAERHTRRLSFRNQRHLYRRKCDATGVPLIANLAPDFGGPVVSQDYWWSDAWDALDFGVVLDFTRPFFEQFHELMLRVPQPGSFVVLSENCEYNAYCAKSRNCYLNQSVAECENIFYTFGPTRSRDCIDCHNIDSCELCSDVVFGSKCYDVHMSKNVVSCQESSFLLNCRSCSNCFFCANLRNSEYCFLNEKLDRATYEAKVRNYQDLTASEKKALVAEFLEFQAEQYVPWMWGTQNENVKGSQIFNSKSVDLGFDITNCEDVSHVWRVHHCRNCFESDYVFQGEELYDVITVLRGTRTSFGFGLYDGVSDSEYCGSCANSDHLFGCFGLRRKSHCILNIEYRPDEYKKLRQKVIAHMKETGEWGEFFPSSMSPFPYNDSVAGDFYPRTRKEVEDLGLRWREEDADVRRDTVAVAGLPERSSEADESVCAPVYGCSTCGRGFKIQRNELTLLQKLMKPLPRDCFECRYRARLGQIEQMALFERECARCNTRIETCWPPESKQEVLCEGCYLHAVN